MASFYRISGVITLSEGKKRRAKEGEIKFEQHLVCSEDTRKVLF